MKNPLECISTCTTINEIQVSFILALADQEAIYIRLSHTQNLRPSSVVKSFYRGEIRSDSSFSKQNALSRCFYQVWDAFLGSHLSSDIRSAI
jgi:hypothetical protein